MSDRTLENPVLSAMAYSRVPWALQSLRTEMVAGKARRLQQTDDPAALVKPVQDRTKAVDTLRMANVVGTKDSWTMDGRSHSWTDLTQRGSASASTEA